MEEYEEPVMFVRHAGGGFLGEKWAQKFLFNDGGEPHRIAVHFQDRPSFEADDYTHLPNRIRRFDKATREPTLVVVAFSELPSNEKYVARTIPDSREIAVMDVEVKEIVQTYQVNQNKRVSEFPEKYFEDPYKVVKTLQVDDWITVHQTTHKLLWDWHSRSTVHDPQKNSREKETYIGAIYHGDSKPLIANSLDNRDQELIAEKYLRENLKEFRIDVPRGGELSGIDILGTAENEEDASLRTVVASVTASTGSRRRERIEVLNEYSDQNEAYFFDLEGTRPSNLEKRVIYVSLEDVFDWMNTDETRRQRSLQTMLGTVEPLD